MTVLQRWQIPRGEVAHLVDATYDVTQALCGQWIPDKSKRVLRSVPTCTRCTEARREMRVA